MAKLKFKLTEDELHALVYGIHEHASERAKSHLPCKTCEGAVTVALKMLERAREQGYDDFRWIRNEPAEPEGDSK